ncbi:MAG: carboxypeptidase regulatory-like domain-containing protein, partial [Candidatus Atribacteria bacterium]|nr:carboxypeptidase regulatory-like domain-containing protein [Candidatus Atribacteria bacterium]
MLSSKNYFKKTKKPAREPSPVMFLAMCLFLILAAGCSLNPTPPIPDVTGSIEGYIFEPTSPVTQGMVLLSGALVSVSGTSNTILTNTSGYFRIDEIPIGEQTVTISKDG